jgi:Uma2 family endonuclease
MLLEALSRAEVRQPVLEALKHAPESPEAGEDRLVLSGITWGQYLEIDEALGHERATPRMYFYEGELEIMTTSFRHERIKKWIGILLEDFFYEAGMDVSPHGQTTIKILKEAGAEPDESWCFGEDKDFPDLILEIALTSGGINKLNIYQRFGVSEVWFWRNNAIEIWTLRASGSGYDGPRARSQLLPKLDLELLRECLKISPWRKARQTFREKISKT